MIIGTGAEVWAQALPFLPESGWRATSEDSFRQCMRDWGTAYLDGDGTWVLNGLLCFFHLCSGKFV